jgi:hypothetical protein
MARRLWLALALMCMLAQNVQAQTRGVAVQVNEGGDIPSVSQLQTVLNPGDLVRDVLGWTQVDTACNLAGDPSLPIAIPPSMATLYANVQAAQGANFVTLAFNNPNCGQISYLGSVTFPNTDALRAEFAAYAVAAVKQVPALAGVSIWNEMNGSFGGGYTSVAARLTNYCALANKVITDIRKVDPTIPIAIGASTGWNIDGWFIHMFDTYGCMGKGDPTIWLDVHPYLTGKTNKQGVTDWQLWNRKIAKIRADGITNKLIATEWGANAAYNWLTANPGGNYMTIFDANVVTPDSSWAGLAWFELQADSKFPDDGLYAASGTSLTELGKQYLGAYR